MLYIPSNPTQDVIFTVSTTTIDEPVTKPIPRIQLSPETEAIIILGMD